MIISFSIQIALIVLVVLGVRRLRAGSDRGEIRGESVRRFFQYILLYGLIVIIAIGFTGLLARIIESSNVLVADQTALARNVSFIVVGVPLFAGLALWTRRQYFDNKSEVASFGWSLYFTFATMTFLVGFSFGLRGVLTWVGGQKDYQSAQMAQFLVWGALWIGHWWVNIRFTPKRNWRAQYFFASLYSLIFLAIGLMQLLTGAFERLLHLNGDSLLISQKNPLVDGAVTAMVGLAIWLLYWVYSGVKFARDVMWLAFVMLVGIGGGLVLAIGSLSTVLYNVLVWFAGSPGSESASVHFKNFPMAAAAALVGGFVWAYHRSVLHEDKSTVRTEVRRVYEYLMSAIGLIASAIGFAIVLVALADALTESTRISGDGSRNTLLAAVTLLIVGGPIWWIYWNTIQRHMLENPVAEQGSPARRTYLFLLFGVGGVTAVITLLIGVFFVFDDIFKGNFGEETIRRIRVPLALLLSTGGVSGYHWLVYRAERVHYENTVSLRRNVLLIGPHDEPMLREISERTGAKMQAWERADVISADWTVDSIIGAIEGSDKSNILILSTPTGLTVIALQK